MEELQVSELGTQEYWNSRYKEEMLNFKDHGDPGEIWFGEDIVKRIITWMEKNKLITKQSSILDIGCGNGLFLIELALQGYTKLCGIDYSEEAIILARSIAQDRNLEIKLLVHNILDELHDQFKVIHDKGTYDAITLNLKVKEFRTKYLKNIHTSLQHDGLFIITSCNWTAEELCQQFHNYFSCIDRVSTPQFTFGGKTGNNVTSLIFQKL